MMLWFLYIFVINKFFNLCLCEVQGNFSNIDNGNFSDIDNGNFSDIEHSFNFSQGNFSDFDQGNLFSNHCMMTVSKSTSNRREDPVVNYCSKLTIKQQPVQRELQEQTLKNAPFGRMMGAPEVITLGENFIHLIKAKRVLDIGTFTGFSALAWAIATGEGGQVYTMDISMENYKRYGVPIISKHPAFRRIIPIEAPALQTLDKMIAEGKSGTFDFAFIDADKENYSNYYDRVVTLLRSGGVLMIDNALFGGNVTKDPSTLRGAPKAIDEMNKKIFNDNRTYSAIINTGDGVHIAFKK